MGSRITGEMVALDIVNAWLHTPFEGGRHSRRLEKIERLASSHIFAIRGDRMGGRS
jgi:ribose 5-phosphate isomerase B